MKNVIITPFVLLSFIFLFQSCQNSNYSEKEISEKEPVNIEQLTAEVEALFILTDKLFENKDADGLANRFTKDGRLKLPVVPVIQGHEALRENYIGTLQLEDFNLELQITEIQISENGDMAFVTADYYVSFMTPPGLYTDEGFSLLVLVREGNSWKIAAEALSSNPRENMG